MPDGDPPAPSGLQILPVTGLGEFRPGDDLAAEILRAAPWIGDGDVLVVTSKVVSKVEGALVAAPSDPEERDALRRRLIDEHTVRLVAQVGRTRIVQNRLGIVAAAAGIDASNVRADEIALLPTDPDASAAALVAAFAATGRRVGVLVTDTQGRAWRMGVTDVAIGAAGVPVLVDHRGGRDGYGNELLVTQVAVGDELAAAADLVKGKLSGVPVAVVRGLAAAAGPVPDGEPDASTADRANAGAKVLIRPYEEDLFRLGTDLAIEQGRREAVLGCRPIRDVAGQPVDLDLVIGHAAVHADAIAVLNRWQPDDLGQRALREAYLGYLAGRPDATARSCASGHLTASAVVLSADRTATLLTLHPRVGRWLQLGGHCEETDLTLAGAALREATEESGIAGLAIDPVPIHLDVHPITCSLGIPTRHFDVRFRIIAPAGAVPTLSAESDDLRFFGLDALPADLDPSLAAGLAAAVPG